MAAPPTPFDLAAPAELLTPALAILPAVVEANVESALAAIGSGERWRPHVKTTKSAWAVERLLAAGVTRVKCATTRELDVVATVGMPDALLSFAAGPALATRVAAIAERRPSTRVSLLADDLAHVAAMPEGAGAFVDLDVGMGRTGVAVDDHDAILRLVAAFAARDVPFRGLHAYDGHLSSVEPVARREAVFAACDRLVALADALAAAGFTVEEIVTSGTGTFRDAIAHPGLAAHATHHTVGPGTLVYGDLMTAETLADLPGHGQAVAVLARVVSRPAPDRITVDAGSKGVSVDQGVPHCAVAGRPWLTPLRPSEEHLPMAVEPGHPAPEVGEVLALVPRHVCTTVALYDHALHVEAGAVRDVVAVEARDRDLPVAPVPLGA